MITKLKLAVILDKLSALVFGKRTNCGPGEGYGSLTVEEVFNDHIKPLNDPTWSGAMIGHSENKFTVLIGVEAEIDAQKGMIQMLESAVEQQRAQGNLRCTPRYC